MISQSTTRVVLPINIETDKYNISSIKFRLQSAYTSSSGPALSIIESSYTSSITSSDCPPPFEAQFIDGFKSNTNTFNKLLTPQIESKQNDMLHPSNSKPSRNGAITKKIYNYSFWDEFSNNKSREEKQILYDYDYDSNSIYNISSQSQQSLTGARINTIKKNRKSKSKSKNSKRSINNHKRDSNNSKSNRRSVNIIRNSKSGNNTIYNNDSRPPSIHLSHTLHRNSINSLSVNFDDETVSQIICNKPTKYIKIKRGNLNKRIKRKMYKNNNNKGENRINNIDVHSKNEREMFQWIDRYENLNINVGRIES